MPIDFSKYQKKAEVKPKVKPEKPTTKLSFVVEKKSKKPKKIAITNRTMTKEQLLDEIYFLGKDFIGNITSSKLRATLEDFKLYSKRKTKKGVGK